MNTRSSFFVLSLFLLLLQACDLFKDDTSKTKSTEFSFTVDTLKQFSQFDVNDLDVINDTSFVITGFFLERDSLGNTKNTYNQIWWGKKKGYEFRAMPQKSSENTIVVAGHASFFAGNHKYYIYGGSGRVGIINDNQLELFYLSPSIYGNVQYEYAELIRPEEFYLYGRNGSLVYYKDGKFSKIETGTTLTLSHASISSTNTTYFYLSPKTPVQVIDSTFYQAGILKIHSTTIESSYTWSVLKQTNYPHFIHQILFDKDSTYIYGNQGFYSYSEPDMKINNVNNRQYSGASFITRNDGFSHLLGQISYWQNQIQYIQVLPATIPLSDLYFINYKGNRVTMINSQFQIINGERLNE